MRRFVHGWRGWTLALVMVGTLLVGLLMLALPVVAQGDDPTVEIEALALRAHLQNMRQRNLTGWIGGDLGDIQGNPPYPLVGGVVEDWTLQGFVGDDDVTLETLARPTLLNFWASWCEPCRDEFPHLADIATHPDDHHFDIVFVNVSDELADAREFLADYPPDLVTTVDRAGQVAHLMQADALPTSLLINTDGTVLVFHVGSLLPTLTAFIDAVAAHPGVGTFDAADHAGEVPAALLQPVDVAAIDAISGGETVTGQIDHETTQVAYRFDGMAGDEVTVSMQATGGNLDCYLVVMTADGERVGEADDIEHGMITDTILTVTLPEDGTYTVVATRFLEIDGFTSGSYALTLEIAPPAPLADATPPPDDDAAPQDGGGWTQRDGEGFLIYNTETGGEVSGMNPQQLYAFEAQAGDVVSLTLTHDAGGVPLTIEVKDTQQNRLAVSAPTQDGVTVLEDLVLPDAGLYRVRVFQQRDRNLGTVEFSLALVLVEGELPLNAPEALGAPPPAPPVMGGDLAYGDTVSGTINNDQYEQRWTFGGNRGDRVTIVMERDLDEPGGLDGYLLLEGPDGTVVTQVDDTGGSVMPVIESFTLPETGPYTIVATRFGFAGGFSTGDYTLTLTADGGTPGPPAGTTGLRWFADELPADVFLLTYNTPAEGAINADNVDDWYIFRGRAGDSLTIRLNHTNGDLDPLVIVTDINGYELATNDDIDGAQDAAIVDFVLPADGTYLIRATRYGFANGLSSGGYALLIETDAEPIEGDDPLNLAPLAYGDTASGDLGFDNPNDVYAFEGRAGDTVTAGLLLDGDMVPLRLAIIDPDGHIVEGNAETQLYNVPLPVDGTYTLEVALNNLNDVASYRLILLGRAMPPVDAGAFEPAPDLDLDVVLIWASTADLDLAVNTPDPDYVLRPDVPVNTFCDDLIDLPVERVAVPDGDATPGIYHVTVRYRFNCGGQVEPVDFLIAVAQDGIVIDIIGGALAHEGDTYSTTIHIRP